MVKAIKARLTSIVYYNDVNGFLVARAQEGSKGLTLTGSLPGAAAGMTFEFEGEWVTHPRYGEQFSFSSYKESEPENASDMERFLASGIIRGVGPKTAKAIVEKFGDEALEIIEKSPEKLTAVDGIGEKKYVVISESYREHKEFTGIIMQFSGYGIGPETAMKLYGVYGTEAMEKIQENPYRMIEDVRGIGFRTADEMAMRLGIGENSEERIRSGLLYVLRRSVLDGNTCMPESQLLDTTVNLLDVTRDGAEDALIALNFDGKLVKEEIEGESFAFLPVYYSAEKTIAYDIVRLLDSNLEPLPSDAASLVRMAESESGLTLSDSQRNAAVSSLEKAICVITGGPGTGKTTVIHVISDALSNSGIDIAIAAPTGRAAKRITEATGYAASTIHRLLEYSYGDDDDENMCFGRTRENPLEVGALIVDEASMIDAMLMKALLEAIPHGARLIIVGDADQLPPVGAGNVLRDMLAVGRTPAAVLTEIFRQAGESGIVTGAHSINRGEHPKLSRRDSEFTIVRRMQNSEILDTVIELCRRNPSAQVLTPTKKNLLGSVNLNKEIQSAINPPSASKSEAEIGTRLFRTGDRVMQTKNNYNLKWIDRKDLSEGEGAFNGDMGIIESIDGDRLITVCFDGSRFATYEPADLDQIEHAYAITVHKSQGSEFDTVILPVFAAPPMLATRNLLYTAVTRGKNRVVAVGQYERFCAMIDNDSRRDRWSSLQHFLASAKSVANLFSPYDSA